MVRFTVDVYDITFTDRLCTIVSGPYFVEVKGSKQVATLEEYTDDFSDIAAMDRYFSLHQIANNGYCF